MQVVRQNLWKAPLPPLNGGGGGGWMVPQVETTLASIRETAFSVVVTQLWNSVPREAHLALSLFTFRRHIKINCSDQLLISSSFSMF